MSCDAIRERLTEHVVASPSPLDAETARHLASCEGCRGEHEALVHSWTLLGAWQTPAPSPRFVSSVMAQVRAEAVCASVRDALVETNGGVTESVRAHTEGCASCGEEARSLRASWAALGTWQDVTPSPSFVGSVMREVSTSPKALQMPRRSSSPGFLAVIGRLAAVFAVVLGLYGVARYPSTQPSTADDPAMVTRTSEQQQVALVDGGHDPFGEGEDVLADIKEPALSGKTDEVIEEVLAVSPRASLR